MNDRLYEIATVYAYAVGKFVSLRYDLYKGGSYL